jgi:RNA polymerase sigma-70 factor (ECF subfamily)
VTVSGDAHDPAAARAVTERVVRDSYGRLVAYLASITGDISEAEDALSDALAAALRTWPERGIPDRPDSWLVTVARRNIIGALRRRDVTARALPGLHRVTPIEPESAPADDTVPDRRLWLMFACSHPAIDPTMRSALMLQTVLGLDAVRIASAFLVAPATMGQRLVRVKAKIKQNNIPFAVPAGDELAGRLDSVLDAIYAAYGTGWDDPIGVDAKRVGLTDEAIRLGRLVADLIPDEPEAHGLLALMLHSDARSAARREPGRYIPLDEQDVTRWSSAQMIEAEQHLGIAVRAGRLGRYQLHAAVQSVHNRRAVTGTTDWRSIASLYDGLAVYDPTVGTHVARAAAHAEADGAATGLALLDALPPDRVERYQPYHAVRAACLARSGRCADAAASARQAIALSDDPDVRNWLAHTYR